MFLVSTSSAFTQKIESVQIVTHRSVKDDEVTSSEETQERSTEEEGKRVEVKSGYDGIFRQTIRPVDITSLTVLPTENIYESAAKLLFLSVKWARTIPSFLQVSKFWRNSLEICHILEHQRSLIYRYPHDKASVVFQKKVSEFPTKLIINNW